MTTHSTEGLLQKALFQAAKAGNINLMREFIAVGADPFEPDTEGYNAIFYAMKSDPVKTGSLLVDLNLMIKSGQE
jgi:ankyrin repeat protein